jgi:hypothetical protein
MPLNTGLLIACLEATKGKLSGVKAELGLTPAVKSAIVVLQELTKNGSVDEVGNMKDNLIEIFPFRVVILPAVLGLHSAKPRLCEMCLSMLHHILNECVLPPDMSFDNVFHSSRSDSISGKLIIWATLEALTVTLAVPDQAVQSKVLECFIVASKDLRFEIGGPILEQLMRNCFNLRLSTSNDSIRVRANSALQAVIRDRVIADLVLRCNREPGGPTAPRHALRVNVQAQPRRNSAAPTGRASTNSDAASAAGHSGQGPHLMNSDSSSFAPEGLHTEPTDFAQMPVLYVKTNACCLDPSDTRDVYLVFHTLLALAVRPIPSTVSDLNAIEVRSRVYALDLVVYALESFDDKHNDFQHRAILPDVVSRLRREFWRCIARNLCYSIPFPLFQGAVRVLTQLALKCHHMHHNDIRWFHDLVVVPLVKSRFSTFDMKMEFLHFYRAIFTRPSLAITFFVNYDCLRRDFDMGTLQAFVAAVAELMFLDFSPAVNGVYGVDTSGSINFVHSGVGAPAPAEKAARSGPAMPGPAQLVDTGDAKQAKPSSMWAAASAVVLSHDQADHLRFESAAVLSELLFSLLRWLEEEEDANTPSVREDTRRHDPISAPAADEAAAFGGAPASPLIPTPAMPPAHIKYHWRHVHQVQMNSLLLAEGRRRFAANWRDGMTYWREHKMIDGTPAGFALFLKEQPRIDKRQITAMFDRLKKDSFCHDFASAWFALKQYRGVTIDVAVRDTLVDTFERPNFDSQLWEHILRLLGEEYARQTQSISGDTADTFGNLILFLHTNLHNANTQPKDKMSATAFVRIATEITTALPPDELLALYNRVAEAKWAAKPNPLVDLHVTASQMTRTLAIWEPSKEAMLASAEIDGNMAAYAENFTHLSRSQQSALILMQHLTECIERFNDYVKSTTIGGGPIAAEGATVPQLGAGLSASASVSSPGAPKRDQGGMEAFNCRVELPAFAPPFYAQHVRPLLQAVVPHVLAATYLVGRLGTTQRQLRLTQQLYARVEDLAAAFGLTLAAFETKTTGVLLECLRQELSVRLGPPDVPLTLHFLHRPT